MQAAAGRVIQAELSDNDFYDNRNGLQGEGMRFVNNQGATGGKIFANLSRNRSYSNYLGMLIEDNRSNLGNITISSFSDEFDDNGNGAVIGGGLSSGGGTANGNIVNFSAYGDRFENNNGFNNFDHGGLVILGGENTSIPNGTSNNTVNVNLYGCIFSNNQLYDIGAFGARSNPESIGLPGTNNRVTISGFSRSRGLVVSAIDSVPAYPGGMNSVTFVP